MSKKSIFILRKVSGRTIHGLSKTDLVSMAKSGGIAPEDEIKKEGHKSWHPASAIKGLPAQQKVSNKEQSPSPAAESRLGKKAIIFTTSFLIIAVVVFGGVFGIWFVMRDYGFIKNTSNNESIATETVSSTTNNESNQRPSIASISSTAPPVEPLDNSSIALNPTAPHQNIEAASEAIEDIRSSDNTEKTLKSPRELARNRFIRNRNAIFPNSLENLSAEPMMISGIMVPKNGPIWVHEELKMPIIGGLDYGNDYQRLIIQPLIVDAPYCDVAELFPQFYVIKERFGEKILADFYPGNSSMVRSTGTEFRDEDVPPGYKAGLGCPVLTKEHSFSWLGFDQIVISVIVEEDGWELSYNGVKSQGLIDWAMDSHATVEYIEDEASRSKGFRMDTPVDTLVYIEQRDAKNEIKRINLKLPLMRSEKVLIFDRDDLGRVIKITEYNTYGDEVGSNCIFEYDSFGRFVKFIIPGTTVEIGYEADLVTNIVVSDEARSNHPEKEVIYLYDYDENARVKNIVSIDSSRSYPLKMYAIHFEYPAQRDYWQVAYVLDPSSTKDNWSGRESRKETVAVRIGSESLGKAIDRPYSPDDSAGFEICKEILLGCSVQLAQLATEEKDKAEAKAKAQEEERAKIAGKPLSAKEVISFCNSLFEEMKNMEIARDRQNARSFISAAEKLDELGFGKGTDSKFMMKLEAFFNSLEESQIKEDSELFSAMNKMKRAGSIWFDISHSKNSDGRRMKAIIDEILIDADLLERTKKIVFLREWLKAINIDL